MVINILHFVEGAREARGLTVVIDVFRAFSLACYVMNKGAATIIPVGDIDIALRLRKNISNSVLMGERKEKKPEGFDYGNSPYAIMNADLQGKTVIHTTSSGTQGLTSASLAAEIITGSFVNVNAIYRYILQRNPEVVSLVCMGYRSYEPTDEDSLLAEYLSNLIGGKENNYPAMVEQMKNGSGKRFFDPQNRPHAPTEDFYLCTDLDRFGFVLRAEPWKDGLLCLKKIIPV